jgi:hypothetical protein
MIADGFPSIPARSACVEEDVYLGLSFAVSSSDRLADVDNHSGVSVCVETERYVLAIFSWLSDARVSNAL